ncbi:MAG TPA: phosphatase PAP2 family protein [Pseudolabrys sp.]|jgi:undecaprenyl-diphosphatase
MTAADGLNHGSTNPTVSALRRCAANVVAALAVLTRPPRVHVRKPWPLTLQQLAIAAGIVALGFLLVQFVADAAAINGVARLPGWVVWFFDQITDFGKSGWFLWPLGILFLALAALPTLPRVPQLVLSAMMVRVGFLFAAIAVPGLFTNIVKHIFGRARPLVGGSLDPYLFSPFSWSAAYAGLPSGHAASVFSVLVAFGSLWPRGRTMLWIYALLIAASRVAVTAHYPSDVLAGAAVGVVGALVVRRYFALRRRAFSIGPDGAVHQRPGPSLRRIKSVARALLSQ